jgi:transposase, IS5 family
MFKILVLRYLHNLSDDIIAYQIRDRCIFIKFLVLQLENQVPGSKMVWTIRERLKRLDLVDVLFARFHEQLAKQGYITQTGQTIDATFVKILKLPNTHADDCLDAGGRAMTKAVAENVKIKEGQISGAWDKPEAQAKRRQKDPEARWTEKNDKNYYCDKNHIKTDAVKKLIQSYAVNHASVHDSQVFNCCSRLGLK